MILIENVDVYGWKTAFRGMRNPMNSWDKSDSSFEFGIIGENDLQLAKSLAVAGADHAKFMRMITVTMDITAPLYWWKEFDTYKVGTVKNSCSTMHKIHDKPITLEDFSIEHLYCWGDDEKPFQIMMDLCDCINEYRERYLASGDKDDWWQMIQLLPSSYNQKATVQVNYAVLRNMYRSRKHHKLDEWAQFCKKLEELPCPELITDTLT